MSTLSTQWVMEWVIDVYGDLLDRSGKPQIDHILAVYRGVADAGYSEVYQQAALLHDIFEDFPQLLFQRCYTNAACSETTNAFQYVFGEDVYNAVMALTRANETYREYIQRCIQNPIARVVKRFDLLHNMGRSDSESLTKRYQEALSVLEQEEKA